MNSLSRRAFIRLFGAGSLSALAGVRVAAAEPLFRIRTITAGVALDSPSDHGTLQGARDFLAAAKSRFSDAYEIQTTRIATQPLPLYLPGWMSAAGIRELQGLDRFVREAGVSLSIGPVQTGDADMPGFGSWAADLVGTTAAPNFSCVVASAESGLHVRTAGAAAEAMAAIARGTPGGEGNFRFCASAFCPPGTPFFPAAWHDGAPAFSIGLETPRLLQAALAGTTSLAEAETELQMNLNAALAPIEAMARQISAETGWRYLGIDTSPAPGLDASIGQVIESLAGAPFGAPATLAACATITRVLQGVSAATCGYSGLMLPVLEDKVLADRAGEGRYGVAELLLFSSVCGTGLDVVPLPGDTPPAALHAVINDVAALAARYRKPLSARLFPVPGKRAGEWVDFDNPYLTRCRVMALG